METDELRRRLRLMVLTDPEPRCGRPLPEVVEECLAAGATAVQLRHKGAAGGELLREALELRPVVREFEALFVVNDRVDVALAAEADGAHLGPEDLPLEAARAAVGRASERGAPADDFLLGYSTDDPDEAVAAAGAGADYLGVGAVFGTESKEGLADEAIGPERVGRVLGAAGLPGVGIGGIGRENAGRVARVGAGVAVLGAVMGAERPGEAVRGILEAL